MAFCRSLFVYLPGGPRAKAGAEVGAREMAGVGLGVPLSLVGALPALRRMRGPAIHLAEWVGSGDDYKLLFFQTGWLTCWVWSF